MGTFVLNFQDLYELDITPEGASPTWARLGAGLSSADPSNNDSVDQSTYLDGDGYGSSDVIGAQKTIAFSGHRVVGDPAQDFIDSIQTTLGSGRKTTFRMTDAAGVKTQKACTVANIDFGGGDAGAKQDVSFEIHLNGKPEITPKSIATALSAVVAAGSVTGTTKFTATPDAGNSLAYDLNSASVGTIYDGQYVSALTAYTSGSDIIAEVDQYLAMYEIDANGRVAKFLEQQLDAGDIAV